MLTPADRDLAHDMARFYADPLGFVMYAFPWRQPGLLANHDGPDEWQRDFLIELGAEVKARNFDGHTPVNPIRMTRASGHGIGKSTLSAWITNWIMSTRPRSKGTITANTAAQLQTKTWAQLQYWLKLSITRHWFEISTERMYARDQKESWFVSAASHEEKNSEAFAGQHAADATSFYIFDESSGISDKIFDVAEGGLTDGEPMEFLFGNPTQNAGKFYRVNFGSERLGWNHGSIDSRTSRFTNKALIAEWAERYGEDSDWFRFRVKGEAPRVGFSVSSLLTRSTSAGNTRRKASRRCPRSWRSMWPAKGMIAAWLAFGRAASTASWQSTAVWTWCNSQTRSSHLSKKSSPTPQWWMETAWALA